MCRVGQNRINTPHMTVHLLISLPQIPYVHRIYNVIVIVLASSNHVPRHLNTTCFIVHNRI